MNDDFRNFMIAAVPGGIEAQEAQGQQDFITTETLPIICPQPQLEHLGFIFGENVDDVFVSVQFPDGWKKVATDHSMWSDLLDDKGRKRASIFYKAAFYDRSADMNLTCKITYEQVFEAGGKVPNFVQYKVTDDVEVIFETVPVLVEKYTDEYWLQNDTARDVAIAWLELNHPYYKDPMAYWN